MKKNLICKGFITLGLLLLFTVLMPFTSYPSAVAHATTVNNPDKKSESNYRFRLRSITLVKGKSHTLKIVNLGENAKVSYKSDDQEIASVSEDGTVTANKVGSTIITATIKDSNGITTLTCDITVGPPAISIKWTQSRVILGVGNVDTLRVILKPSNTVEDAKFSSNNNNVVSISPGGRITAKGLGMTHVFAFIEATNYDGTPKRTNCTVIVTSQSNAPLLETYFKEHPEFDLISELDFTNALQTFFDAEYDESTLVESLDKYLNGVFDLKSYRKTWEEREAAISKFTSNNTVDTVSVNAAK